jgi:hypothetical protein
MFALSVALRVAKRGELLAHRVVVSASGCGAECSAMLAYALAESLRGLGFDAAVPDGPARDAFETPAAVRAFARSRGARTAVTIALAIEDRAALASGGTRVSANASLYVMDAARHDAPRPAYALRSVADGDDEHGALVAVARNTLRGMFPVGADALLGMRAVAALQVEASGLGQQAAALAIGKHARARDARRAAMREYAAQCAADVDALAKTPHARCVTDGCAREYAVAMLPDASAAVVHDSGDSVFFPFEPGSTPRRLPTSERLWLVARTGQRELLAEAADFELRPDLSRDGRVLAFVEQRSDQSALYALLLATRERRLIASESGAGRVSSPRLSPDGSYVLYYVQDDKQRRSALRIARTSGAAQARTLLKDAIDARWVELPAEPDAPDHLWVAALVQEDAPDDDATRNDTTLLLIDAAGGNAVARQTLHEHSVRALGDVDGGALYLSWHDERCGFARFRAGRAVEWHTTALCPKHIAAGKRGVFAHARAGAAAATRQVVRVDADAGELQPVTRADLDAQAPRPAADAGGLVYERVLPQRYGELRHVAVCFDDADDDQERERDAAAGAANAAASSSDSKVSAVCRASRGRNKACH